MNESLRLFACTDHEGWYLDGISVILARDEEDARALLDRALTDAGLIRRPPTAFTLKELPLVRAAHILWDGDY